jgi:hypothetical protein
MSRIGIPASARANVAALMHADLVPVIHDMALFTRFYWDAIISKKKQTCLSLKVLNITKNKKNQADGKRHK